MALTLSNRVRGWLSWANGHPLWSGGRTVWGSRLSVPTADRLLYVTLHQWGLMGADDRRFYEAEVRPGMTVLDIGANIGLCTLLFSRLVGPSGSVHAFEPAPELARALDAARPLNGADNVTLHPVGLSDADEDRPLRRALFNSGDNRVSADAAGEDGTSERIRLRRGDGLLPAPLAADFIKIDVQGWELHALRGLKDLISRSPRVQIYFEFWPTGLRGAGTDPLALPDFLRSCGLTILRPAPDGGWVPADDLPAVAATLHGNRFINLRAVRPPWPTPPGMTNPR